MTATRPADAWLVTPDRVAESLDTDLERGLSSAEARRRLGLSGRNELVEPGRAGPGRIFARQLANTMTVVLAVAAAVTVVIGDITDAVVIGVIVVINAMVGFVQEYRAERAVTALKRLTTGAAIVVRDGVAQEVPAPEVVPGDVVELAAGDVVPADIRLSQVNGLRLDEAALTGESEPASKTVDNLGPAGGNGIGDRRNMAFKGTAVVYGRARGVVVNTGMATELGRIAGLIEAHHGTATPLERRLAALGRRMAAAAFLACGVVFAAGLARGEPVKTMFLTSVSLAVAAIPEGLPAVVTVALALGARRMADRRAVVRRLSAVETLGSVTVVCTDKTGTLTENRMMVERIWTPTGSYWVTGNGYAPEGRVRGDGDPAADAGLLRLAEVAAACGDAEIRPPSIDGSWTATGDPTEAALVACAAKLGVERTEVLQRHPRVAEIAFDPNLRHMTTVHHDEGGWWVATKGALGALVPLTLQPGRRLSRRAAAVADEWADQGYRVLALAERHADNLTDPVEDLERGIHLLGLVGISDPPRREVARSIDQCRAAGISTVMITGDHPRTARAIARRIGLVGDGDGLLTGSELDALDDSSLAGCIANVRVFARTDPAQKLRIVEAWKRRGAVVAMTGDGVNDAPALRRADIGVAMGLIGTDVSREVADMVLADDNFATIVAAVEEGRRIYDSIRRFVRYLLTTNLGEIWVMAAAPFLGLPLPLLPIQILWVNLVTDGLPAIALGLEPAEPESMRRPPRPVEESILGGGLWQHSIWVGLLMAAVVLVLEATARAARWPWQTMVFTTLALLQLGHALAVRSERRSSLRGNRGRNRWLAWALGACVVAQLATVYAPPLRAAFHTDALGPVQLAVVLGLSLTALLVVEAEKAIRRRRARDSGRTTLPGRAAKAPRWQGGGVD